MQGFILDCPVKLLLFLLFTCAKEWLLGCDMPSFIRWVVCTNGTYFRLAMLSVHVTWLFLYMVVLFNQHIYSIALMLI